MSFYQSIQGNLGLARAIAYFGSHSVPISLPLNDTQKYDLVVEIDGELKKVSIKTSRGKTPSGAYSVQLRNTGGNRTGSLRQVNFDNTLVDYVFVYTEDGLIYLIPSSEITVKNSMSVSPSNDYKKYIVEDKTFSQFSEEN